MEKRKKVRRFRVSGLSFAEELKGEKLPFGEKIIYLGLNRVLAPCNWACKYCLEGCQKERKAECTLELSLEEQLAVIDDASGLSMRGLLITGGEPLAPARLHETLELAKRATQRGMIPLIYTNGSYITKEVAKQLAESGSSVSVKIDSLVPAKYNLIAGREGAYKSTLMAIKNLKATRIGRAVAENEEEVVVRLLFSTVGNALNVDEYISIARFATQNNARWMMEVMNNRGNAARNLHELALQPKIHEEAMRLALAMNPEQGHEISGQGFCRLFYAITVNTSNGNYGSCPQDYNYLGNIRRDSLAEASKKVLERANSHEFRIVWERGVCPVKAGMALITTTQRR